MHITAEKALFIPIERSIPPLIITKVIPIAISPSMDAPRKIVLMLVSL
jgi:hypothetical protein